MIMYVPKIPTPKQQETLPDNTPFPYGIPNIKYPIPKKELPSPALIYQYGNSNKVRSPEFLSNLIRIRKVAEQNKSYGWYDADRDELYSRHPTITLHEQRHRDDFKVLGNPSQSLEFRSEVDKIPGIRNTFANINRQDPSKENFYSELYATLWELANGDINKIVKPLQRFYSKIWK